MKAEIRRQEHYPGHLEVRAAGDEGERRIAGLGIPYGVWSVDLGGWREMIVPGAFRSSIEVEDLRVLHNHDSNYVLGRKSAGTAHFIDNSRGVEYEVTPPDTAWARDVMVSIERRDITGNSFGFLVRSREDQEWEERDGIMWRRVLRGTVLEMGPQPFPAYEQSEVEARSLRSVLEEGRRMIGSDASFIEGVREDLFEQEAALRGA